MYCNVLASEGEVWLPKKYADLSKMTIQTEFETPKEPGILRTLMADLGDRLKFGTGGFSLFVFESTRRRT